MHCITLVGGIPACGKTELLNFILTNQHSLFENFYRSRGEYGAAKHSCGISLPEVHIISIDMLCSVEDQAVIIETMHGWKNFRVRVLEAAEHYICEVCGIPCHMQGPLPSRSQELLEKLRAINASTKKDQAGMKTDVVFLVEDNFYYRSMRYEWFQVARRDGLGFSQIYLTCSVEVAIERNLARDYNIPEYRIRDMFNAMDYPDPEKNKWEKFSLLFDTTTELEFTRLFPIVELIISAMKEPVQKALDHDKLEAQIICSRNVIHQTDKALRKITGEVIKGYNEERNRGVRERNIQQVIINRQRLLSQFKQGTLQLPHNVTDVIEKRGADNSGVSELEDTLRMMFFNKFPSQNGGKG